MKKIIILILIILVYNINADINDKKHFFKPVIDKMIKRGVDTNFINHLLQSSNTQFNEKYVKINVTGFLGKPDYSKHYNATAVSKSKSFLNDNIEILEKAEYEYGVPKEIITSILYIETRHGGYLGYNHIPSVYLSTAMANEPEYIEINKKELRRKFKGNKSELPELDKKIEKRAEKKANWALNQLVALEIVDTLLPIPVIELEGSWAGAFGISQFLPESYVKWAVDGNNDNVVNLFEVEDAVFSVANYLKTNGWGNTEKKKRAAVFHYNNSTAYVNAVLKLAKLIGYSYDKGTQTKNGINKPLDNQIE